VVRAVIAMNPALFDADPLAKDLPISPAMPFEVVVGRWLAVCAHPVCAWRGRGKAARLLVVSSYFAAGFVGVLVGLLSL
jgi:hypothetical protein